MTFSDEDLRVYRAAAAFVANDQSKFRAVGGTDQQWNAMKLEGLKQHPGCPYVEARSK